MINSLGQLEKYFFELETALLRRELKTPARLNDLIDDDFIEIGASGRQWTKQDVIHALQHEPFVAGEISEFKLKLLTQDVALVTYLCLQAATSGVSAANSLRSSIWTRHDGLWRLVFHQGTVTANTT